MTTFFQDTFTESGSATLTGHAANVESGGPWIFDYGTAANSLVTGGMLFAQNGAFTVRPTATPSTPDQTFTGVTTFVFNNSNYSTIILLRYDPVTGDSYRLAWGSFANASQFVWGLYRYVGSVPTLLAQSSANAGVGTVVFSAIGAGSSVTLTATLAGTNLFTPYVDTDASRIVSTGTIGLYVNCSSTGGDGYPWTSVQGDYTSGVTPPTLTTVSPSSGAQGATTAVTLTGTGFNVGTPTVNVSGSNVTVGSVVVVNSTSITCNMIAAIGAAAGARNVTVTTTSGTSGAQTFTITGGAIPTLTSVLKADGVQDSIQPVVLTGTNMGGGSPSITVSGSGVTGGSIVQTNSTSWTANLTITSSATLGARTLSVTTAAGTSNTVAFTVLDRALGSTATTIIEDEGSAMELLKATARNVTVKMRDSTTPTTGKTALTLTILASKDGGAFASISPVVTELGYGVYSLALNTTHTDTEGTLELYITGTGAISTCKTYDVIREVVLTDKAATSFATLFDNNDTASTLLLSELAQTSDIPTAIQNATQLVTTSASTPVKADIVKVNSVTVSGNGNGTPMHAA